MSVRADKLGVVIAAMLAYGAGAAPFATVRANRIVPGEGRTILEALPDGAGILLLSAIAAAGIVALLRTPALLRLSAAVVALAALAVLIGVAALHLTPPESPYARISPASGFWLLLFALALLTADALTRLRLSPLARVARAGRRSHRGLAAACRRRLGWAFHPEGICLARRPFLGRGGRACDAGTRLAGGGGHHRHPGSAFSATASRPCAAPC